MPCVPQLSMIWQTFPMNAAPARACFAQVLTLSIRKRWQISFQGHSNTAHLLISNDVWTIMDFLQISRYSDDRISLFVEALRGIALLLLFIGYIGCHVIHYTCSAL